jgi:phosphatidate phosphatase PAH1
MVHQGNASLPEGPIILHPGSVWTVLHSEMIAKDTDKFKTESLVKVIFRFLFSEAKMMILKIK